MHIPDGYLSPQTCLVLGGAMLPIWATAAKKMKNHLRAKQVPLLAIGAAFSFTIMMYNIPIPGGTTAHAAGSALLAIVLGPWAAAIAVTVVLAIQALLFGDGGVWAFGANVFNMAFIAPFSGYLIYRIIAGSAGVRSTRRWVAGLFAGYISICLAAVAVAVELGLQPVLFKTASGMPLYSPYGMGQALAAMSLAHLLVAGPAEGLVTGLVIKYFQSSNPSLLSLSSPDQTAAGGSRLRKLWWGLAALLVLSPVGMLAKGTAWGEWGLEAISKQWGYIPQGMSKYAESWKFSIFPDYSLSFGDQFVWQPAFTYVLSAVAGLVAIFLITYLVTRVNVKEGSHGQSGKDS
ncbi:MAG: cobalt transporter CbiM [Bacillota bacterium]